MKFIGDSRPFSSSPHAPGIRTYFFLLAPDNREPDEDRR